MTATSTACSAKKSRAPAVSSSKYDGSIPESGTSRASSVTSAANCSSVTGSPFQAIRSLTRWRCGEA
jgi:hypothetical protein